MAKVVKRSVLPIYAVAAVWLVFGLFLPLYQPLHYVTAALVSLVAFVIVKALCPDRSYETPEPEKKAQEPPKEEPASTGNQELDALIRERDRAVSEMRRLNDAIDDPTISAQIDHLESTTKKIISHVVEHPKKLPQIRKFLNYYLPTTLKILNAYDRMGAAGVSGENIDGTMDRIEGMMGTVVQASDRRPGGLYGAEALDISTDITVLDNLLSQEGLAGERLGGQG